LEKYPGTGGERLGKKNNGRELSIMSARAADAMRGKDIVIYNVADRSDLCDYLVIITVESRVQARAVIEEIVKINKRKFGESPFSREGSDESSWFVLDYVDSIIHIFSPPARVYYNLEGLWGDAPIVKF
jgi:ribosome-associated protein